MSVAQSNSFTHSQREKIAHFKSVTNIQSDDIARYALQKTNWDVTNCISLYFENPNSFLNNNNNNDTIINNNNNNNSNINNDNGQQTTIGYYASYIPGLTSLGSLITSIFSYLAPYIPYFTSIFSMFGGGSSLSTPYSQIVREFKEKHGINDNIFIAQRFGELMNRANDKCIFIYFNDNNNNNAICNRFVDKILCDESVMDYLKVNMMSYVGDNRNIDGRQLFAQITHQFNEKRKPFVCIAGIHPQSNKLVLVHRQYVGNCSSPLVFIANILDHGLQRWQQFKFNQIKQQQVSQSNRNLREMQDMEYQRALIQQQEEEQQQQETQEPAQAIAPIAAIPDNTTQINQINKIYQLKRMEIANAKISKLTSIIENSAKDKLIRVALRLPNGERVQHIFCNENLVESLFDFALCHELKIDDKHIDEFELVCSYPKKIFTQNDKHLTLESVGIEHSTILFVQEQDSEYSILGMNPMFEQQLTSIKILLLETSNDRKWNNLRNELVKYEMYLQQQLSFDSNNNNNNNNITNGIRVIRPTKPPLRLKSNSVSNDHERGRGDDDNCNENENEKNKIFPTKPPMRLKQQSQLNKNNPLLRLFIRLPTNRNEKITVQTIEIVIWHGDDNEIQQVVNKLCSTNQLQEYKNDIKNTIVDLIK